MGGTSSPGHGGTCAECRSSPSLEATGRAPAVSAGGEPSNSDMGRRGSSRPKSAGTCASASESPGASRSGAPRATQPAGQATARRGNESALVAGLPEARAGFEAFQRLGVARVLRGGPKANQSGAARATGRGSAAGAHDRGRGSGRMLIGRPLGSFPPSPWTASTPRSGSQPGDRARRGCAQARTAWHTKSRW